jgi:hypothetical protein
MINEIIAILRYHRRRSREQSDTKKTAVGLRSDAEIITTALTAALFFCGNQETAGKYMHSSWLNLQNAV